jgi:hypothetical protein
MSFLPASMTLVVCKAMTSPCISSTLDRSPTSFRSFCKLSRGCIGLGLIQMAKLTLEFMVASVVEIKHCSSRLNCCWALD